MSKTYVAAIIAVLASLLPLVGVEVADSEALTGVITNAVSLVAGAFILADRVAKGDISWLGLRKK